MPSPSTSEAKLRPRLVDVAERCGVNPATVSRVLNDDLSKHFSVREELRQEIVRTAREMHYVPHSVARQLRGQGSRIVGLLGMSLNEPYHAVVADAIESGLSAEGYFVSLGNTHGDLEHVEQYLNSFASLSAEGLLCTDWHVLLDSEIVRTVVERLPKTVFFGCGIPVEGVYSVDADRRTAARLAVRRLLDRGRRNVGIVMRDRSTSSLALRYRGFVDELQSGGMTADESNVFLTGAAEPDQSARIAAELIAQAGHLDAVVVDYEATAFFLLRELRHRGIAVPDDLAVITIGNLLPGDALPTALCTVDLRHAEVGNVMVDMLLKLLAGDTLPEDECQLFVEPRLVVRETT